MKKWIGLDFETSGETSGHSGYPVEIGLVSYEMPEEAGNPGEIKVLASSLVSGAKTISYHAYLTHGIRLKDTLNKPRIETFIPLIQRLGENFPFCVHAKGTERKILNRLGICPQMGWIDTLTLSRQWLTGCPNHRLATVTNYLDLERILRQHFPKGRWHRAAFDAAASALIAARIPTRTCRDSSVGRVPLS